MLFALGAVSGALDALQLLTSSKTSAPQASGIKQPPSNPFAVDTSGSTAVTAPAPIVSGPQISPQTMSALITAQGQSAANSTSSPTTSAPSSLSRQDALKDLFSQIDADGDGKITKSEFESALGAGGTNLARADDVFSKLDANSDGSVDLGEMGKALKGGHHAHRHAEGASAADGSGDGSAGSDPLTGAKSTSVTNSDGSTTTTLTYADGSKVSMTVPAASGASSAGSSSGRSTSATSSYNWIEQMIQRDAQAISNAASRGLSVTA